MPKRKSPIHHQVGPHARRGKKIDEYERGEGDRPAGTKSAERNIVTSGRSGKYQVTMTWDDNTSQTENLNAPGFYKAALNGMGARGRSEIPIELRVVLIR